MGRHQLLALCHVTVLAISLSVFSGCDLGTYSNRSTEFLKMNPGGVKKEMKKMEKEEEANETSAVNKQQSRLSRKS